MKPIFSILALATLALAGCAPTAAISTPSPTPTEIIVPTPTEAPTPPTATATATPKAIETQQSEAGHIKWERVEANREAVNDYVFVDTIFGLNEGGAYFTEYGITTKEELKQFLADNGGYFPASQKNSHLVFFWSRYENSFQENQIRMDKKIKADLDVQIVNPDQIDQTKIYGGQVHPWFLFQGQEGTSKEKCVSVAIAVDQSGSENKIVLQLVWEDGNFDLLGNKLQVPNVATPEMVKQANKLLEGILISGNILGQPKGFAKLHPNIMLSDSIVLKSVFNF